MSSKYKVGEDAIPHFVTFSVVGWIDVFSREEYKEIFVESLQYSINNKGLIVHAWAPIATGMTNHDYKYSSAIGYYSDQHGLLNIQHLIF